MLRTQTSCPPSLLALPTLCFIPRPLLASVTNHLPPSAPTSSLKSLVVGTHLELTTEVTLWNDGEDSYGTTVTFSYPLGLSYRRVAGSQVLSPQGKDAADGWGSVGRDSCAGLRAQAGAAIALQPLINQEVQAD